VPQPLQSRYKINSSIGKGPAIWFDHRMPKRVTRRVGWEIGKKLVKAIPYIGAVISVVFIGHAIKKKGLLRGAAHVALDVTPVVGTAKNVIELVTGDWIPDKAPKTQATLETRQTPAQMERGGGPNFRT
jgi:hypothetical protein